MKAFLFPLFLLAAFGSPTHCEAVTTRLEEVLEDVQKLLAQTRHDTDKKSSKGRQLCPVFTAPMLMDKPPPKDRLVHFASLPTRPVPAQSEQYINVNLGDVRAAGFDEVMLAVSSKSDNAHLAVLYRGEHGLVSRSSDSSGVVRVPASTGGAAHAVVAAVDNKTADVSVWMAYRNAECVMPFDIAAMSTLGAKKNDTQGTMITCEEPPDDSDEAVDEQYPNEEVCLSCGRCVYDECRVCENPDATGYVYFCVFPGSDYALQFDCPYVPSR